MLTERTLKRRFKKETTEGTLPPLLNGAVVTEPLYSMAGVTTPSYDEWKTLRGHTEQEDEGSVPD
jgi:hypothetical protein